MKIFLNESHEGLIEIIPKEVVFNTSITSVYGIIKGVSPGHVEITAQPNTTEYELYNQVILRLFTSIRFFDFFNIYLICLNFFRVTDTFIRVLVANSRDLITFSNVIGWLYFVAWSVSFYPQIYTNFRRKSVIGLNFDFLSLNIVGFILYGVFNIGLYSIPQIQVNISFFRCYFFHFFNSKPQRKICQNSDSFEFQEEYSRLHPRGLNPVQLNDVFFAVHATIATLITIAQCFFYEVNI